MSALQDKISAVQDKMSGLLVSQSPSLPVSPSPRLPVSPSPRLPVSPSPLARLPQVVVRATAVVFFLELPGFHQVIGGVFQLSKLAAEVRSTGEIQ